MIAGGPRVVRRQTTCRTHSPCSPRAHIALRLYARPSSLDCRHIEYRHYAHESTTRARCAANISFSASATLLTSTLHRRAPHSKLSLPQAIHSFTSIPPPTHQTSPALRCPHYPPRILSFPHSSRSIPKRPRIHLNPSPTRRSSSTLPVPTGARPSIPSCARAVRRPAQGRPAGGADDSRARSARADGRRPLQRGDRAPAVARRRPSRSTSRASSPSWSSTSSDDDHRRVLAVLTFLNAR